MASGADQTSNAVNRERVLVVDDDSETRESVGQALEQADFAPTLAATGEQGLVLLREWPRRIGWLYTKAELPGLVGGWILADEFHQATRLGPYSTVFLDSRRGHFTSEASP